MLNVPSGQSHQLSTGTVEKPTSPVGFFTSEIHPGTRPPPDCLIVFSSFIMHMCITLLLGESDMSTQSSTPDSYGESASMILTKNVEQEKNDMEAMNQFMDKAGVLTDDDFFGSL